MAATIAHQVKGAAACPKGGHGGGRPGGGAYRESLDTAAATSADTRTATTAPGDAVSRKAAQAAALALPLTVCHDGSQREGGDADRRPLMTR